MSVLFCLSQEPFFKRKIADKNFIFTPTKSPRRKQCVYYYFTPVSYYYTKTWFPTTTLQHTTHFPQRLYYLLSFLLQKTDYQNQWKKSGRDWKSHRILAIEHTRILYQQYYHTTTDEEHTPLRDLLIGVYFFPYQFSIHYWFPASFLFYRNTEPQQMIQKNIHTKVKTQKTKLFGERIKTIYTLKVRLLHQNIPLYITNAIWLPPFHRKTHYANQNKQTTTLQNLSTGNWKRHWTPLTTQIDPSLNNFLNTLKHICCKTILPFLKGNWLIDLFTKLHK